VHPKASQIGVGFSDSASIGVGFSSKSRAAQRTGAPDEPGFWLGGVEDRRASACHRFLPMAEARALSAVEGDRCNREPNDLKQAKPISFTKYQEPITKGLFLLIASCYLLAAKFSKTVHCTTFSLWSESPNLPFVRPSCQVKITFAGGKWLFTIWRGNNLPNY
jgi:hypothetical protein